MRLVPMTEEEYSIYLGQIIPDYAAEHVRAGNWTVEEAEANAASQMRELLPEGVHTPDNYLYTLRVDGEDASVGLIWLAVIRRGAVSRAFIYDIVVYETYRRRGYATQALREIEAKARDLGANSIGLHVFGHNQEARALYEKLGYVATDLQMAKDL